MIRILHNMILKSLEGWYQYFGGKYTCSHDYIKDHTYIYLMGLQNPFNNLN